MPTVRVNVKPELLRWARERARLEIFDLESAFPKLVEWERGEAQPTLKQLEGYARRTRAPLGYFFLDEPPEEPLPLPDFRTIRDQAIAALSPDLLDAIYTCQMRQDWYRENAEINGEEPLALVGSLQEGGDIVDAAATMRARLRLDPDRRATGDWEDALRGLITAIEDAGILVMRNGVVGNNTHRALDVGEFRGFALSDPLVPLIFVNAKDTRAAQMFTLAHELVHVFLGRTGVSDASPRALPQIEAERWCNQVAAEFLVPLDVFDREYRREADVADEMRRLATRFKVSTLVVLRRMHDVGGLNRNEMWAAYDVEVGGSGDSEARPNGMAEISTRRKPSESVAGAHAR